MIATGLALITNYGVIVLFATTFLSCLALPVPASLMMLAGGGFAASGDLVLTQTLAAAFCGAVLGDNAGYWLCKKSGAKLTDWLHRSPSRAALIAKAEASLAKWGGSAVFLSRWLFSPLGPYVNLVAGLTALHWPRFVIAGALGEAIWVGVYVGLGYSFADQMTAIGNILGNASGFLAGGLLTAFLGRWLWLRAVPAQADISGSNPI
jgi:membrane-associated protein